MKKYNGIPLPFCTDSRTTSNWNEGEIKKTVTETWKLWTAQYESFREQCEAGKDGYALASISPQREGDLVTVQVVYGPEKIHGTKLGWWTSTADGLVYNEMEKIKVSETAAFAASALEYKYGLPPNGMSCSPSYCEDTVNVSASWGPLKDVEDEKEEGKEYLDGISVTGGTNALPMTPAIACSSVNYTLDKDTKMLGLLREVGSGSITQFPPGAGKYANLWHRGSQWARGVADIVTELVPEINYGEPACAIETMKDIPYATVTVSVTCSQYHKDQNTKLSDVIARCSDVGKLYKNITVDGVTIPAIPITDPQIRNLNKAGTIVHTFWKFEGPQFRSKGKPQKIRVQSIGSSGPGIKTLYKFTYTYNYTSVILACQGSWDPDPIYEENTPSGE